MNTKYLLLTLLASLLASVATTLAGAPSVLAVGANTITVKGVTYQVPASAQIVVDGLSSKLSDVRPGMLVDIVQGMDRGTVDSIVSTTIPPAKSPKIAYDPKGDNARRHPKGAHSLFQGVAGNIVIAITPERITYGAPGTAQSHAALITAQTIAYVAGERQKIEAIEVGMPVDVTTTDGTHADVIRANDPAD